MAVEFKKYAGADNATLEDQGTVKAIAGKGGKIALIRKNYNDATKRVAVLITRKDGQSAVVACSAQVSKALREKKMNINQLLGLSIVSNEDGLNFISMGAAGAVQSFEVDKVKEQTVANEEATFLPEEVMAL